MKKSFWFYMSLFLLLGVGFLGIRASNAQAENPVINSIDPTSGKVGQKVTITGSGFGADCGAGHNCNYGVGFGGAYADNHNFGSIESWTDTKIVAIVPTGATTGSISVSMYYDSNGIESGGELIQYSVTGPTFTVGASEQRVINSIFPTSGVFGALVTIDGTGFENACDSSFYCNQTVKFGDAMATNHVIGSIVSWTDTRIKVKVPTGATTAPVVVSMYSDSNGPDAGGESIQFSLTGPTFNVMKPQQAQPRIDSISPQNGKVGTKVVISGSNFGSDCGAGHACNMNAWFGKAAATNQNFGSIESWTDTKIVAIVPTGATTAPVVVSMYYDSNGPESGGTLIQYSVTGPVFTIDTGVSNTNTTINTNAPNTNAGETTNITNAYGCDFSLTAKNTTTVKVKKLFARNDQTDAYLAKVSGAYFDAWARYPRCDELQFHLDHSTSIERLQGWLQAVASRTPAAEKQSPKADIILNDENGEIKINSIKNQFAKDEEISLSGVTTPNSTVIIKISSEPKIYIAKSDLEGFWNYLISDTLEAGSHGLQIEVEDKNGNQISSSEKISFAVDGAEAATTNTAAQADDQDSEKLSGSTISTNLYWALIVAVALIAAIVILFLLRSLKRHTQKNNQPQ